jgi:hypothetical protein
MHATAVRTGGDCVMSVNSSPIITHARASPFLAQDQKHTGA